MCLHYLVKLIAWVLSPYITNTPCFVTKVTCMFHNSLNVKMFANMYRKCWFADVISFVVTVLHKMRYNASQRLHVIERVKENGIINLLSANLCRITNIIPPYTMPPPPKNYFNWLSSISLSKFRISDKNQIFKTKRP